MYNDFSSTTRRSEWRYSYLGKELLPFAKAKYEYYTDEEQKARNKMADMLRDPNVRASDPNIDQLKRSIESFGSEREKCIVWLHEFTRKPDVEYNLCLGDVTYFGIAKIPS